MCYSCEPFEHTNIKKIVSDAGTILKTEGEIDMSPAKIVRIVGLVLVLVAALIPSIPYVAIALAIVGLLVGYYVQTDNRAGLFLMVIALTSGVTGALGVLPVIGVYLTAILTSLGVLLSAAAVTIILTVVYERLTE